MSNLFNSKYEYSTSFSFIISEDYEVYFDVYSI